MTDTRIRLPYYVAGLPGCRGVMLVPEDMYHKLERSTFLEIAEIPKPTFNTADLPPYDIVRHHIYMVRYHTGHIHVDALSFASTAAVKAFRRHLQGAKPYKKRPRPRPRYSLHDR
jgi:hypothetical protein